VDERVGRMSRPVVDQEARILDDTFFVAHSAGENPFCFGAVNDVAFRADVHTRVKPTFVSQHHDVIRNLNFQKKVFHGAP